MAEVFERNGNCEIFPCAREEHDVRPMRSHVDGWCFRARMARRLSRVDQSIQISGRTSIDRCGAWCFCCPECSGPELFAATCLELGSVPVRDALRVERGRGRDRFGEPRIEGVSYGLGDRQPEFGE